MKLCRYYNSGEAKPAIMNDEGELFDISFFGEDFNERFFTNHGVESLKNWANTHQELLIPIEEKVMLAPAFQRPSKIVCVGLNYVDHASEVAAKPPKEPILFFKSTSALSSAAAPVYLPKGAAKLDYEVELGVVIGKEAQYVAIEEAMDYVAGYVLTNDYSERSFQLEHKGQWVKGKSHASFAPMGPFMASKDEIPDPQNLNIWLKVNGEVRQSANTRDMIFSIPFLISYISGFMALLPGDVICTGTPAGVGIGFNPPQYLKEGDIVRYGIDGLGEASQEVAAFPENLNDIKLHYGIQEPSL